MNSHIKKTSVMKVKKNTQKLTKNALAKQRLVTEMLLN